MICHGVLIFQTECKRFNQDCSKIFSSLQQQAPAATSASAAAAAVLCFAALKQWSEIKPPMISSWN
jgi:hypothetical protein